MILLSEIKSTNFGKNVTNVIYKITNLINGKIYVGKTNGKLRKRILSHISHANPYTKSRKHYFQFAIQKYGLNNFGIDVLEYCNNKDLNAKEIYWIRVLESYKAEKGYNCTYGGDGCPTAHTVSEVTRNKISLKNKEKWNSEAYRNMQRNAHKQSWANTSYKIVQLDNALNFIKLWNSKKEIVNEFGSGNFGRLTYKNPRIYSNGFVWVTKEEYNKILNYTPLLVQTDYNLNIINFYYDYKSANREIYKLTGHFGHTQSDCKTIRNIQKGMKRGGYLWLLYTSFLNLKNLK